MHNAGCHPSISDNSGNSLFKLRGFSPSWFLRNGDVNIRELCLNWTSLLASHLNAVTDHLEDHTLVPVHLLDYPNFIEGRGERLHFLLILFTTLVTCRPVTDHHLCIISDALINTTSRLADSNNNIHALHKFHEEFNNFYLNCRT